MAYLKDFIEHCVQNSTETMEYYDDICNTREYNHPDFGDFRKVVDTHFNNFCFNNGLFQSSRLKWERLDDTQRTFFQLIGVLPGLPKNRYHQQILQFYLRKCVEGAKIGEVQLEDMNSEMNGFTNNYYSECPPIFAKIPRVDQEELNKLRKMELKKEGISQKLLAEIKECILTGSRLQFNVDGFPKNEMLYLLYGLAIRSCKGRMLKGNFKTFAEIVKYLKSFIQLNLASKCFDVSLSNRDSESKSKDSPENPVYNLITYLKMKDGRYNYRYQCADKYFKDYCNSPGKSTEFIENEIGEKYIFTKYDTMEELREKWNKLEEEWGKERKITHKLIEMWFDGQLLTRSTCLIGCILIMLMEDKKITFKPNEMPDWCSIAGKDFKNTYFVMNESAQIAPLNLEEDLMLKDVLDILKIYVLNIRKI